MADMINVYSTVTQAEGFRLEAEASTLLGTRYFPNGAGDNFVTSEVLFDYEDEDLKRGVFVTRGYKGTNTTAYTANTALPPRIGHSDTVDPMNFDRIQFERLVRMHSEDGSRAPDLMDLAYLKSARLARREDRSIEILIALILKNGGIDFDQEKTPGSADTDHINLWFYDLDKGCNNHVLVPKAWGEPDAHPYDDVCKMVSEGRKRGRKHKDLLLGENAWQHLSNDEKFMKFAGKTFHSEGMAIDFGEIDGATHVAKAVFNGVQLDVLVYSGAYENEDGELVNYIDPDAVILISPEVGRTLCGGVCLLNDNVSYDLANAIAQMKGKHIQHLYKDFYNQILMIRSESRPLPAPKHSVNAFDWIYMECSQESPTGDYAVGEVANGVVFDQDPDKTWASDCECTADVVLAGEPVDITLGEVTGETVELFAVKGGKPFGTPLDTTGDHITIPAGNDKDADGNYVIWATSRA